MSDLINYMNKSIKLAYICITCLFLAVILLCVILLGTLGVCEKLDKRIQKLEAMNGYAIDKENSND